MQISAIRQATEAVNSVKSHWRDFVIVAYQCYSLDKNKLVSENLIK